MIMENTTAAAAAGMLMTIGVWDILDITFDRIKPVSYTHLFPDGNGLREDTFPHT